MKQLKLHGVDDVRLEEAPEPDCGPADVIVDVAACGICGSDLGFIRQGGLAGPGGPAMALGHEFAGTISEVGENVSHWQVGQAVTVNPMSAANLIGNGGPEGGFAHKVCVREAEAPGTLLALPLGLDPFWAALAEPLSVAFHAVSRVQLDRESRVLVLGAGPIGLGCVVALKRRGVKDVVVVEPSEFRRKTALRLGADAAFAAADEAFWPVLAQRHGTDTRFFGMPLPSTDAYLECTGSDEVVTSLVNCARPDAQILLVAAYKHEIPIDVRLVMAKELRLAGTMGSGDSFQAALDHLRDHGEDLRPMISHSFPLEQFLEALAAARNTAESGKVLVTAG